MHFDQKVMDDALKAGMGKAPVARHLELDAKDVRWIQRNVPIADFKEYLLKNAFVENYQFCAHSMYSVKEMIEANNDDYFLGATKKYLLIGRAPNGDRIAIDKAGYKEIGFIGHEDPDRWSFVPVDSSISNLFWKSWNEDGYPWDFYQAERYYEKKRKA